MIFFRYYEVAMLQSAQQVAKRAVGGDSIGDT